MDIGTWGDRGLASIAQSGHIRLGALRLLESRSRETQVWFHCSPKPLTTLSVSKRFWESSPVCNTPPMEWNENLKERGEGFRESDGGTAEAGDTVRKQNQTALECDDPPPPCPRSFLHSENRIQNWSICCWDGTHRQSGRIVEGIGQSAPCPWSQAVSQRCA